MTDATVTPITRELPYSDTAALNDIHALLTATDPGNNTMADIGLILARAHRPLIPVRDITATVTETALGWPVACVEADGICVFIRQAPASTYLAIEVCTKTEAEHAGLTITLDGRRLHPAGPFPAPAL